MVDRDRSPIRTSLTPSVWPGDTTDPVETEHEADIEAMSLRELDLTRLLGDGEADFGSTTVRLDAEELVELLVKARHQLPAARSQLTTQPYDQVTASELLDKDIDALDRATKPEGVLDADAILELDDAPPITGVVHAAPIADVVDAKPIEDLVAASIVTAPTAVVAPDPDPISASIPPAGPPPASPVASTRLPVATVDDATRTSLPSAGMEWPGARDRKRRATTFVAIGSALATAAVLYLFVAETERAATAPSVASASLVEVASPAPVEPAQQAQSPAEIDARKALDRLREGIGDCVRHAIGSLPGSSPAVPPALKLASGAGYTAPPADWKTAVWSCAKFRHDAPMRFQLQWQSVKPTVEALGIAWLDDDGDGEPDRALGFRATAKGVRDVDLSEITPMEMRPVLPVR